MGNKPLTWAGSSVLSFRTFLWTLGRWGDTQPFSPRAFSPSGLWTLSLDLPFLGDQVDWLSSWTTTVLRHWPFLIIQAAVRLAVAQASLPCPDAGLATDNLSPLSGPLRRAGLVSVPFPHWPCWSTSATRVQKVALCCKTDFLTRALGGLILVPLSLSGRDSTGQDWIRKIRLLCIWCGMPCIGNKVPLH